MIAPPPLHVTGQLESLEALKLFIAGVPAPQGSKTRTRWGMREDNPATRPWRAAVAHEGMVAMAGRDPFAGPLALAVTFTFPRPRSHFGSGRNAEQLRPSAPAFCEKRPDLDKLLRAIGDALTGIAYRDDAQLVSVSACKRYGIPGATITLWGVSPCERR